MEDNQPRYTTKRLHDEIEKAKLYGQRIGLERAISYHEDLAAQHAASHYESQHHELMEKSHLRDAEWLRKLMNSFEE